MTNRKTAPAIISFLAVLLGTAGLAACTVQPTPEPTPTQAATLIATPFNAPALFVVILPGGMQFAVTADVIASLPESAVTIDGTEQTGPKLSDILTAAGVSGYTQLVFSGSSILTVDAAQVTDQFILDLSNRGTYKMASPDIPKADWVKDIISIEVK